MAETSTDRTSAGRDGLTLYRAYTIDEANHVARAEVIEAENELDAIELARKLVNGRAVELWDRARLVARLEAMASAAAQV